MVLKYRLVPQEFFCWSDTLYFQISFLVAKFVLSAEISRKLSTYRFLELFSTDKQPLKLLTSAISY